MKTWERIRIGMDTSVREALEVIDKGGCQIALVVDAEGRLLGTFSDGDARRGMLHGLSLDAKASSAMNPRPTCAKSSDDRRSVLSIMYKAGLRQIPLLDEQGRLVGLELLETLLPVPRRENWVVIMAGGRGTRLQELTQNTPKPMLKVGNRPILETIVLSFADHGFYKFVFAVHYKAEQIKEHFGDGSSLGVSIQYLHEERQMGTAGALCMLPTRPDQPIVVTNADLLTNEDFGALVDDHARSGADATLAIRDYEFQIPYGVVKEFKGQIQAIEEKPIQRYCVNAGMYVLSPNVLDLVPSSDYLDMPTLFEVIMRHGRRTRCHRISGYWLDIGRVPDFQQAAEDYARVFPGLLFTND